jgi:hypothetical protein
LKKHSKRLIFGGDGSIPNCVSDRCYTFNIAEFKPDDYAFLCGAHLGPGLASQLDYQKVFRFAPKLERTKFAALARG